MEQFKDKTVLVSGGTRGIGKAIALAFLQEGAKVIVTYASNQTEADKLKEYENISVIKCNVASFDEVQQLFETLPFEKLDILINNAGIRKDQIVGMMDHKTWQDVIDINLTGSFNMSKFAVLNMMKQRYGRIINITSPCSHFGFQGQANYAASKAGQIGLMRSLSKEVAKRNITVNCISPGFIDTELIANLNDALIKQYKSQIPLKKFGSSTDIANAVLFLASDKASYITGTTLEVTGGL